MEMGLQIILLQVLVMMIIPLNMLFTIPGITIFIGINGEISHRLIHGVYTVSIL